MIVVFVKVLCFWFLLQQAFYLQGGGRGFSLNGYVAFLHNCLLAKLFFRILELFSLNPSNIGGY